MWLLTFDELIRWDNIRWGTGILGPRITNINLVDRADAVKDYLVSHGIASDRLTTQGYGFSDPVAPNDNRSTGRAENRRVQFKNVD